MSYAQRLVISLALLSFLSPGVSPSVQAQEEFLKSATSLPVGRAFHGSVVLKDHLYVLGGLDVGNADTTGTPIVLKAPIRADHSIGEWTETTPMPVPRHYIANATLALNDRVYVLGGSSSATGGAKFRTVLHTEAEPGGDLAAWRESPPIPGEGVGSPAAVATAGFLHLIGGILSDGSTISKAVWSARVELDGGLGEWETGPELPEPLWFHNAAAVGGRVLTWGGLHVDVSDAPSDKVYSAQVLATGRLGAWNEIAPNTPTGFYSATTAVTGPYLFSIFPRYAGRTLSSDIVWTYTTPSGLAPWQTQPTASTIRVYHPTAIDYRTGAVYIAGGKGGYRQEATTSVFYFELTPEAQDYARRDWVGDVRSPAVATARPAATPAAAPAMETTASAATSPADTSLSPDAPAGFSSLPMAQNLSVRGDTRPLVVLFTSSRARDAKAQTEILKEAEFRALSSLALFAWVDVAESPQAAQEKGVFQVPFWIFYDRQGREAERRGGLMSLAEIAEALAALN